MSVLFSNSPGFAANHTGSSCAHGDDLASPTVVKGTMGSDSVT